LEDPSVESVDGQTYGPLKALCEQAARQAYVDQHCTILRPGLIVGPYDNTDRFTYWPARAARGGRFIAPGSPSDPMQIIDARDLAEFSIACLERQVTGTFNVISPPNLFSMGDLIDGAITAAQSSGARSQAIWLPAEFLAEQQVTPWADMPVWVPDSKENFGFSRTPVTRAQRAGMQIRPLANTLSDTLRWHLERPAEEVNKLRAGLSAEREAEVLTAWDNAQVTRVG
jgi:2'-hydroxyisoflavone reductase